MLGQVTTCGATRLDANRPRPLFTYRHTRIVVNGEVRSVSHTPADAPFLLALGSPFGLTLSAALTPSAALWGKGGGAYSLFLIGLAE